jgi:hypothetical protein
MPFGAGPRICVGNPFALTERVLVVATKVRSFRVSLAPHRPVAPVGIVYGPARCSAAISADAPGFPTDLPQLSQSSWRDRLRGDFSLVNRRRVA